MILASYPRRTHFGLLGSGDFRVDGIPLGVGDFIPLGVGDFIFFFDFGLVIVTELLFLGAATIASLEVGAIWFTTPTPLQELPRHSLARHPLKTFENSPIPTVHKRCDFFLPLFPFSIIFLRLNLHYYSYIFTYSNKRRRSSI